MLLRYLLSIAFLWGGLIWSQCQTDIDFNTWSQEGFGANGNWIVQGGGTSVFQTINGDPTFYVSPDTFINVVIQGTIAINDNPNNPDDDYVGFVFGYNEPETNPNLYDFWLFDWKAADQTYNNSNNLGREGFALTKLDGFIPQGPFNYLNAFWSRINSPSSLSIATQYGQNLGWTNGQSYDFTLIYTSTRTTILIDSTVIFDLPGCYEAGRFGFYNYSQPNVRYSNFSYRLISNFELQDNSLDQCIGEPIQFSFTDSSCVGTTSAIDNIASWSWDFGDGSVGSTQTNPKHIFPQVGNYDITLNITDVNGCQDSVTKTVTIHPAPVPTLSVPDSIWCPQDSVQLIAGGGATYKWLPGAAVDNTLIPNPTVYSTVPTTFTVKVFSPMGCRADTQVYVHFFETEAGPDLTICDGDTVQLSVLDGQQFAWTPSGSLDDPSVASPNAFPTATTSYEAIAIDDAGCQDTVTQIVTVNPLPNVSLSPDTAICVGEPVTFMAQGAATYVWQEVNNTVLGTDDSLVLTPPASMGLIVAGTDTNNCVAYDTTQITVHPLPVVEAGTDQGLCVNASLTLGSGTNPAGTYLWSPAQGLSDPTAGQPVFSPAMADTVTFLLTLTDLNGCVNQDSVTIQVRPFSMTASAIDVPCFGEPGGSITINASGSAPYQYSWLDGGGSVLSQQSLSVNSATKDSLFTGNYVVAVVDSIGCTDTLAVFVDEPNAPLSLTLANLQDVDCFGNTTGEISVNPAGGTPGYRYSLNGGLSFQTSNTFAGLGASVYTVTARDTMGCEATLSDTVKTPSGLFAQLDPIKHIDCYGNANGAFTVTGGGGQSPYQTSLDGIAYSPTLQYNNLPPGQDTLWFIDANSCLTRVPFEIYEPDSLVAGLTVQKDIACFGDNTGEVMLTATGGSGVYQFQLGTSPFHPDSVFSGLTAGTYTVQVQDDSLCLDQLTVTIVEPPLLNLAVAAQRDVACFGQSNGAVSVVASGGVPGYSYAFDTLAYAPDTTFSGLAAGNYQISVLDDSGCVALLPVEITQPDSLVLQIGDLQNVACFGDNTGSVQLTTAGGTAPFVFSANGGIPSTDSLFTGLVAGGYQFVVVDDSACVDTVSATVVQADSLSLRLVEQIDIDCFGNDNGLATISGAGGVAPYVFRLDGQPWGADTTFANLTPGFHLLEMQDDSSCVKGLEVNIFEPELLRSEIIGQDVRCFGEQNGEVQLNLLGGTQPYIVRWSTGDTSLALTNLFSGLYVAEVVDDNGCVLADSVEITQPDSLTISLIAGSVVEAFCDWPNGAAEVTTAGGTLPHNVQWVGRNTFEGYAADQLYGDTTYLVSVTDLNGCVTTIDVVLPHTPPPVVAFETSPSADQPILLSDAHIEFLNLTQGAVTYLWDFGDGELSVEPLPVHAYADTGTYQVTLTAENAYFACPTDTTITLRIIPDGSLYLPTAFSPNGDGVNDEYRLGVEGTVSCQWQIFDRWGRLVASFDQPDATWDGRSPGGTPVQEGSYVIRVEVEFNTGYRYVRSGTVTLLR